MTKQVKCHERKNPAVYENIQFKTQMLIAFFYLAEENTKIVIIGHFSQFKYNSFLQ